MSTHYPLKFTLEDGVHVLVSKTGENTYEFIMTPKNGPQRSFTFVEDDRTRDEMEKTMDFDQLNAVRAFWLKQHPVI